jgi:hypothetical protein
MLAQAGEEGAPVATPVATLPRPKVEPIRPAVELPGEVADRVNEAVAEMQEKRTASMQARQSKQQKRDNLEGKDQVPANQVALVRELERVFRGETQELRPDYHLPAWGNRERYMASQILERLGGVELASTVLRYGFQCWEPLKQRFFKGQSSPLPSLGFFYRFAGELAVEAQDWVQVQPAIKAYNDYWDAHNRKPPSDITDAYMEAKKVLKALGLEKSA